MKTVRKGKEKLPFTCGEKAIIQNALEKYAEGFEVQYPVQCKQILKLAKRIGRSEPE